MQDQGKGEGDAQAIDIDNDNDNDNALQEADALLQELGVDLDSDAGLVIDGFAIDSDGEDDNGAAPASAPAAATAENQDPLQDDLGEDMDHPLSEVMLGAPPAPASGNAPTTTPGGAMATGAPGINVNGASGTMVTPLTPGGAISPSGTSAAVDRWTQHTSRFASSFASMAKQAASQVAAAGQMAASTAVQPVSRPGMAMGMGVGMAMDGSVGGASMVSSTVSTASSATMTQPSIAGGIANGIMGGMGAAQMQPPMPANGMPTLAMPADLTKDQKETLIKNHVGDTLEGEQTVMFLSNLLHVNETSGISFFANQTSASKDVMWCCVVTIYRIILFATNTEKTIPVACPPGWDYRCWMGKQEDRSKIEMPLASIDRLEKTVYQAGGSSFMGLVITSKENCRMIRFSTSSYQDTGRALESLNSYAFPGRQHLGYLFAFERKRELVMSSIQVDPTTQKQTITIPPTPKRFDAMAEYSRLLQHTGAAQCPWSVWPSINSEYRLSASYPSVLAGPASLDETKPEALHTIRQCAAFRSEQRLPSLTWCGAGGASIWRASQPKVGLQGNRSSADEVFLRHVVESARSANAMVEAPPSLPRNILQHLTGDYTKDWAPETTCGLKILDLRPRASAMANRTGGYGYENTSNYLNTTLQFCNIGNIHAVRDSYQRLCSVCNNVTTADVSWNSLVEDTKWLSHVRLILAAAWETAYWTHIWRLPVLVHCSHGWDRTSQVCVLAQILLDPHYRTCKGFATLVEKDFMSFGHPFHLRCAHGEGRSDSATSGRTSNQSKESQTSPIFLQFMDCMYQIVALFPECFEFNTSYVLELSNSIYSCRFGNMLCDSEREREVLANIRQRTFSVWDYLEEKQGLKNPSFRESDSAPQDVLLMPLPMLLRGVHLWKEKHCRYSPKLTLKCNQ